MDIEKIKINLQERFQVEPQYPKKRHIIFWYDAGGVFKDIVEKMDIDGVRIIHIEKGTNRKKEVINTNIFELKYTLEVEDQTSNILVYSEYPRPTENRENFLLDIELYSEYFEANKTSMIVEEFGFDRDKYELIEFIKEYENFFGSKERISRLKALLENKNPKEVSILDLKRAIISSLVNIKTLSIDEVITSIILDRSKLSLIDKWFSLKEFYLLINKRFNIEINTFEKFMKILMIVHFYKGIKNNEISNTLENYYVGEINEIFIYAENLIQNKNVEQIIKREFYEVARDLEINKLINKLELVEKIEGTTLEYFDETIIQKISKSLDDGLKEYNRYKEYINIRIDGSPWIEKYSYIYQGLLNAIRFFELMEVFDIRRGLSLKEISNEYEKSLYEIDSCYRNFYYSYDKSLDVGSSEYLGEISRNISYLYENEFLEKINEEWSSNVNNDSLVKNQKDFYRDNIANTDTRVAVIVSDALRYEVGREIYNRLEKEGNSKEIVLESMITSFPSITSLGMANLLPHKKINYDINSNKISIDTLDTLSTKNREKILQNREENSSAITYADMKKLKRNEQEEYVKGKKVIYIYHDTIDAIGDKPKSENEVFEACNKAIDDITILTKTLASIGIVNILITSDHGFLYERNQIEEHNKLIFENSYEILAKRYALSDKEYSEKGCISIKSDNYYGVYPIKNNRIKSSGGGLQFVHGGISIQETLIPLIKFKGGANSTRAKKVRVKLKEELGKITSNTVRFSIYQIDAANISEKLKEREITVALYDEDKSIISNEIKLKIDSDEKNTIYTFNLTLRNTSSRKGKLIIRDLETKDILDEKNYDINISIASDFDF